MWEAEKAEMQGKIICFSSYKKKQAKAKESEWFENKPLEDAYGASPDEHIE